MDVLTHLMFQDGRRARRPSLGGRPFIAFDSPVRHDFDFTPSTSIFVRCDDEEQVRVLFAEVAADGAALMPVADYGFSSYFGWAVDRYGVSWQVGTLTGS